MEITKAELQEIVNKLAGVDGLKESINQLNKFLLGNGQKGILDRMTMNEEHIATLTENINRVNMSREESTEKLFATVEELTQSVEELKDIVKDHVQDEKKHTLTGLVLNTKNILLLGASFVIFHEIIESGGPAWEMIRKFLGL